MDEVARAIAHNTPLAVEVEPEIPENLLREPRVQYSFWGFDEAAWQVETVLEWLSR